MTVNRYTKIVISNTDSSIVYRIDGTTEGLGISSGSMNLEEIMCDQELSFGQMNANKFEVQIYGLSRDVSGMRIVVYDEPGDITTRKYIFTGTIESSKTDNYNGYRDIVAYDQFYFVRDVNMASWWTSFWDILAQQGKTTTTLREIRESMLATVGLDVEPANLVNDDIPITKFTDFTIVKFQALLQMICEIQCCFPNINRRGQMEYIRLGQQAKDITGLYETGNTTFEDFTTAPILGVNIFSSSDELSQTIRAEGYENEPSVNAYPISGNIFLLSMTAENLQLAGKNILDHLMEIQYVPMELPLICGDYQYELGDKLITDRGTHYVMRQRLSGTQLLTHEISTVAHGEFLNQQASSVNNGIITGQKFSAISQDIDKITMRVGDVELGVTEVRQEADKLILTVEGTKDNPGLVKIVADLNGLTVNDESTGGTTMIKGGSIRTVDLFVNYLWPLSGKMSSYLEMQDSGMLMALGKDSIDIGYTPTNNLPYLRFGGSAGTGDSATMVKRYKNGIWIGDASALSNNDPNGTGLYIDLKENVVYKYVNGEKYELADSQTVIATFG